MTIQLELNPETEARLTAAAQTQGLALEQYAVELLQDALTVPKGCSGRMTPEQLHIMLREIGEGSENLPILPDSAFSRESFYEDRG